MVDSGCRTCGGTGWVDIPHPTTPTMQVCPCDRRTPPTPATDEREAVDAAFHKSWCAVIDLLDRDYITPAKLREAIVPFVAAEILAAEARGMGRARTVVQNTRDGMKFDPSATLEWRNAITGGFNAADLALRHELDAIERNETEAEATAAWNRRTPPPPATDAREAVAQWCSGCHEVRSVDCYRADCPKSDTERRAAEILAAEANERARIVAWLREDALRSWGADCSGDDELTFAANAIEHGAGK